MAETRDPLGWMWTYSGKQVWPDRPDPEDICIEDIAHALSMQCRYNGHVSHFYSVAEHSVLVSLMVPPELAIEALLHDATEAYCGDLIRPIKMQLPEFKRLEGWIDAAIRLRFRLPPTEHPLVKQADNDILHTEYRWLMRPLPASAVIPGTFDPSIMLFCWQPVQAEIAFLDRYQALVKASGIRNS